MNQISKFVYDIMGVLVPGIIFLCTFVLTVASLVDWTVAQSMFKDWQSPDSLLSYILVNTNLLLTASKGTNLSVLAIVLVVIFCYLLGIFVLQVARMKDPKLLRIFTSSKLRMVYDENKPIVDAVVQELIRIFQVDQEKLERLRQNNNWTAFLRWANLLTQDQEKKDLLNQYNSRYLLFRSFRVIFGFSLLLVLLLPILLLLFQETCRWEMIMVLAVIYLAGLITSSQSAQHYYTLTGNEAILMLQVYFIKGTEEKQDDPK